MVHFHDFDLLDVLECSCMHQHTQKSVVYVQNHGVPKTALIVLSFLYNVQSSLMPHQHIRLLIFILICFTHLPTLQAGLHFALAACILN